MIPSPESSAADPTYLEFFGLKRAPFPSSVDPGGLFHNEQYQLLLEHMEYAAANADCLVVACGADGSGKSTLISRFMGAVQDRFSCVLIDAAAHQGAISFYTTFLQQIGFEEITGTANELANITKEFLVCRGIARDHVLLIFDNTHLVDPRILEQLRRLCEIKVKDRRAVSVVLFGNADIVRVVDAPAMRQTVFANHVVFNIRSYSEQDTTDYLRHRLELAGADDDLSFSDAVCSLIHRYTGGIPARINKLGVDTLEEACRQRSRTVSTDIVRAIINQQHLLPHVTPLAGKGRRRSDPGGQLEAAPDAPDLQSLQVRVAVLEAQIDDIEASRSLALREVDERNRDIQSLRDELEVRNTEAESLSRSVAAQAAEMARQDRALSDRARLLAESESDAQRLGSELSREARSREAAQEQLDQANAAIAELTRSRQELQATVHGLQAELRDVRSAAAQRAVEAEALERTTVHLNAQIAEKKTELESLRSELASRNAAVAELGGEVRSREDALQRLDKANATILELTRSRDEQREAIDALTRSTDHFRMESTERMAELESMRAEMASRNAAFEELELRLGGSRSENDAVKAHIATLKDPAEFQALERQVQRLGSDLETEREARRAAEARCDEATAAAQQLREHERQLQATARQLDAELKSSREKAFAVYSLESYVAELQKALEERTGQLNARTHAAAVLAGQVEKLRTECEAIRKRASVARPREVVASRPAVAEPVAKEQAYSSQVVALYERSLARVPAYRMLKERDPGFYDGWMKEYQVLAGQGLSETQINDALRVSQARWMERKLPRASDQALIAYARLLVDQLDEFLRDSVEPCLSLLVPHAKPFKGAGPAFSRHTGEHELDLLNMVLTTYDARRVLPEEHDVWPDLEPIFAELFNSFGADNVAAIENSFDPKMDRSLLCNVSKTLFRRLLDLPESKAAAALRWMLASK